MEQLKRCLDSGGMKLKNDKLRFTYELGSEVRTQSMFDGISSLVKDSLILVDDSKISEDGPAAIFLRDYDEEFRPKSSDKFLPKLEEVAKNMAKNHERFTKGVLYGSERPKNDEDKYIKDKSGTDAMATVAEDDGSTTSAIKAKKSKTDDEHGTTVYCLTDPITEYVDRKVLFLELLRVLQKFFEFLFSTSSSEHDPDCTSSKTIEGDIGAGAFSKGAVRILFRLRINEKNWARLNALRNPNYFHYLTFALSAAVRANLNSRTPKKKIKFHSQQRKCALSEEDPGCSSLANFCTSFFNSGYRLCSSLSYFISTDIDPWVKKVLHMSRFSRNGPLQYREEELCKLIRDGGDILADRAWRPLYHESAASSGGVSFLGKTDGSARGQEFGDVFLIHMPTLSTFCYVHNIFNKQGQNQDNGAVNVYRYLHKSSVREQELVNVIGLSDSEFDAGQRNTPFDRLSAACLEVTLEITHTQYSKIGSVFVCHNKMKSGLNMYYNRSIPSHREYNGPCTLPGRIATILHNVTEKTAKFTNLRLNPLITHFQGDGDKAAHREATIPYLGEFEQRLLNETPHCDWKYWLNNASCVHCLIGMSMLILTFVTYLQNGKAGVFTLYSLAVANLLQEEVAFLQLFVRTVTIFRSDYVVWCCDEPYAHLLLTVSVGLVPVLESFGYSYGNTVIYASFVCAFWSLSMMISLFSVMACRKNDPSKFIRRPFLTTVRKSRYWNVEVIRQGPGREHGCWVNRGYPISGIGIIFKPDEIQYGSVGHTTRKVRGDIDLTFASVVGWSRPRSEST